MNQQQLWRLGIITGAALLGACQSSVPNVHGQHEYSLEQTCPTLLNLKVGEVLVFRAPENPSTGYQWQLLQPLKLFKAQQGYSSTAKQKSVVGAGGEKTFYFKADQPGEELIQLAYIRAWEHQAPQPGQLWQCRVRVS